MSGFRSFAARVHSSEEGHSLPAVASLLGGAGVVVLGVGAAGDNDALTLVGGIVGGLGVIAASTLDHIKVEWELFTRLDKLEKK
ncbi:hypothetical protein [Candidatus Amarobacter glycogenicus]|jgi:hypothetical protein|uniref:hypothetical protein n=1 Tax=Candidatus Amarobacter glycogenicus TaxID=3140699 RepID=UPI002A1083EB|nr:hypothetical protein [Dehalococcoidia bacterium]MCC6267938.1 hypothetical protein [Dehalococcoidia bacterium]